MNAPIITSAQALMAARRTPLRLVIFDCDGVLVDSEPIAGRLVAEELARLGWLITPAESHALFLGLSLPDMLPIIEARLERRLPDQWTRRLALRLTDVLQNEAVLVPGAREVLEATSALGLPWCIASNSSHAEMAAKFACTGLTGRVAGRLHSAADVGRGKPAPDLFLAAAAAGGAMPADCVVIEDSLPGATAAARAGMPCLGFAPHGGETLRAAGAAPFRSLSELPALFATALRRDA